MPVPISDLCPPSAGASRALTDAVVARAARRLDRVRNGSRGPGRAARLPAAGELLRDLRLSLVQAGPAIRRRFLHSPGLRGFLAEAELWLQVIGLARAARGRRATRAIDRLFDRVCGTDQMIVLLPRGRIDAGFPGRARRLAGQRLRRAVADLAAALLGLRLALPGRHRALSALHLEFHPDPEQGRPFDRIDLGTIPAAAGLLTIAAAPSRRSKGHAVAVGRLQARLAARTLFLRAGDGRRSIVPVPGTRLGHPARERERARAAIGPRLLRRPVIPGTTIALTPQLHSTARRLRIGRPVRGLGMRLARALRLVQLAWPEAHAEILRRTRLLVPVRETGLVSYSLASRPGVSFINVTGKATLDLADDLLHETAHHLLHDLQEVRQLLRRGPATAEVQAFDSPWRGNRRPLHGLLHGAYTFLFRADLFDRVLRVRRRHPRLLAPLLGRRTPAWIASACRRELRQVATALADLDAAARDGLIRPAGRSLLRGLHAWHRRLSGRAPSYSRMVCRRLGARPP